MCLIYKAFRIFQQALLAGSDVFYSYVLMEFSLSPLCEKDRCCAFFADRVCNNVNSVVIFAGFRFFYEAPFFHCSNFVPGEKPE